MDAKMMDDVLDELFETVSFDAKKDWRKMLELGEENDDDFEALGGAGSGNFGHEGRPGHVGGSGADVDVDALDFVEVSRERPYLSDSSRKQLRSDTEELLSRYESQSDLDHKAFAAITGSVSDYYAVSKLLRNGPEDFSADATGAVKFAQKQQEQVQALVAKLDEQFNLPSAVALESEIVFRGAAFKKATFKVGDVFEDKSYAAVSLNAAHAATFAHGGANKYLLQIEVEKGQKMVVPRLASPGGAASVTDLGAPTRDGDIKPVFKPQYEAQVVFPRGTRFKVLSVGKKSAKGGIRVVRVKVL